MIKKYSDNKLIALNMIWSMVAVAVNYAITFFMTSYVTNTAGAERFGFVTLSNTLTSYIDVISNCIKRLCVQIYINSIS